MRESLLCLALLTALAACGDENRTPTRFIPSNDRIATSANDSPVALAPVIPSAPDTAMKSPSPPPTTAGVEVTLAPLDASPLRGVARITAVGTRAAVATRMVGGHAGTTYAGAIRLGTCGEIGASVASLNPVTADSTGTGASASRLSIPLDSLLRVPTVVVFGPGGRPAACGKVG